MRVVRQSLSCGGMYLARRKQLKAFARHTGSHCRRALHRYRGADLVAVAERTQRHRLSSSHY
ncbi:hypothetical protein T07_889 [Trichinella nelsoni]|uniref:Uncharacterized protein n=1 Tax=Trichinella nelsoni TaxID=6336 RepID=A0A0V0RBW6_9BILA|nr:hypothetical protein T07_889 [Trichinella nelsoni]